MLSQTSYYSQTRIFSRNGTKYIEKAYPLHFYTRKQIEDLRERMLIARSAFEELHIPVSGLIEMEIQKDQDGFKLVVVENFEGLDFVDIVDNDNFEMYLDKMLDNIYLPLLKSASGDLLKVGIDTAVRNCVYKLHSGEFCYVDFMPPKVFYKGHYTQEVPEITGPFYDIRMFSHNDPAGIVYTLYINLARLFPQKRKSVIAKIDQFLETNKLDKLKKHLTQSPFYRLTDLKKASEVVENLDDWKGEKYLQLREAAVIAAEARDDFRGKLEDFFKLTHHETDAESEEYGLLPTARFREAKRLLIEAFKLK
ncbi:MAG: hypothetical protein ACE5DX_04430 [Candidatus Dojkabacteria bacterium]